MFGKQAGAMLQRLACVQRIRPHTSQVVRLIVALYQSAVMKEAQNASHTVIYRWRIRRLEGTL